MSEDNGAAAPAPAAPRSAREAAASQTEVVSRISMFGSSGSSSSLFLVRLYTLLLCKHTCSRPAAARHGTRGACRRVARPADVAAARRPEVGASAATLTDVIANAPCARGGCGTPQQRRGPHERCAQKRSIYCRLRTRCSGVAANQDDLLRRIRTACRGPPSYIPRRDGFQSKVADVAVR